MKSKLVTRAIVIVLIGLAFSLGWLRGTHNHQNEVAVVSPAENSNHTHDVAPGEEKVQYTCGMHPWIIVDEPGTCPICQMELTPLKKTNTTETKASAERKIKYWVAPMDPTYIRDEPGKSPMGMDLVPVYEDETVTGSQISIDPVTRQNMGIRTAKVERRKLSREIRTNGLIDYEEPRQYSVNTKIDGWIEKLYINETGVTVKKGQPLLEIYSPELVSAQEEYLLALKNYQQIKDSPYPEISSGAERLLEASKTRLKLWDISAQQLKQLQRSGTVRRTLTLYAPYAGTVTSKQATEGSFTKSGTTLFSIADLSKIWVFADIYESDLQLVKEGQHADILLPFVGDKQISGTVSILYPYVDPRTRTIKARIDLDNRDFDLRPDMFVNVRLKTQPLQDALAIPAEAVINSGEKQTVIVLDQNGRFEPRLVKTGLLGDDGYLQIRQGLTDKDTVVTSAQFLIDSESQLQEAIQKMLEPVAAAQPAAAPESQENLDDLF